MADLITQTKVDGPVVGVVHVDDSGTEPVRTVLFHATKGDLSLTVDENLVVVGVERTPVEGESAETTA